MRLKNTKPRLRGITTSSLLFNTYLLYLYKRVFLLFFVLFFLFSPRSASFSLYESLFSSTSRALARQAREAFLRAVFYLWVANTYRRVLPRYKCSNHRLQTNSLKNKVFFLFLFYNMKHHSMKRFSFFLTYSIHSFFCKRIKR